MELFGPVQLRTLPRLAETQSDARKKRKQGGQNGRKFQQRALVLNLHMHICYAVSTHRLPAMQRPAAGQPRGTDAEPSLRTAADPPIVNEYQLFRGHWPLLPYLSTRCEAPEGVSTGQCGPRLAAFIRLLIAHFRLSKRRASSLLSDLLNIPCSPAWMVKI